MKALLYDKTFSLVDYCSGIISWSSNSKKNSAGDMVLWMKREAGMLASIQAAFLIVFDFEDELPIRNYAIQTTASSTAALAATIALSPDSSMDLHGSKVTIGFDYDFTASSFQTLTIRLNYTSGSIAGSVDVDLSGLASLKGRYKTVVNVPRTAVLTNCSLETNSAIAVAISNIMIEKGSVANDFIESHEKQCRIKNQGKVAGFIKKVKIKDDSEFKGFEITALQVEDVLRKRCIWGKYTATKSRIPLLQDLFEKNVSAPTAVARKLDNVFLETTYIDYSADVAEEYSNSGQNLDKIFSDKLGDSDFCFSATFDSFLKQIRVYFYKSYNHGAGSDTPIKMSVENGCLVSPSYTYDITNKKTSAIVCGTSGTSVQFKAVNDTPTGWDRDELYVDARDISTVDENGVAIAAARFQAMLVTRGTESLKDYKEASSFEAARQDGSELKLNRDYCLGDIVTVSMDDGAIEMDVKIEKVNRKGNKDGDSIDIGFGEEALSITKAFRLMR